MQLANQLTLRVNFVLVFWLRRKKLLTFFPKLFQLPTHIFIYIYNLFIHRLLNFDTSVCTLCVSVCFRVWHVHLMQAIFILRVCARIFDF